MPSSPTEEGSDVRTTENYVQVANEEGQSSGPEVVLGGARVSATVAAAAAAARRPTSICCLCMEPWSCSGAHRICCIPCGHVYGRSCLEKWLVACGNTRAKCPQCSAGFKQKHIINIYTPEDLFDGCSLMQEVETQYSKITKFRAGVSGLLDQHASENMLAFSKANAEISKLKGGNSKIENSLKSFQSVCEMTLRHYMELSKFVCQNLDGLGEGDQK